MKCCTQKPKNLLLQKALENRYFDSLFICSDSMAVKQDIIDLNRLLDYCFSCNVVIPPFSSTQHAEIVLNEHCCLYFNDESKEYVFYDSRDGFLQKLSSCEPITLFNFVMFFRVTQTIEQSDKLFRDLQSTGVDDPNKLLNFLSEHGNDWVSRFLLSYV